MHLQQVSKGLNLVSVAGVTCRQRLVEQRQIYYIGNAKSKKQYLIEVYIYNYR